MWITLFPRRLSVRARMTFPRASSRVPVFPVFPDRSEPARSTRRRVLLPRQQMSMWRVRMVAFPVSTMLSSSSVDVTTISLTPTTTRNEKTDQLKTSQSLTVIHIK
uniref:Uncharacterized protein n=1 Tax=Oryzias melastigma TaxID=30732 RepID=A0A3B3CUZ2_ORYME